MRTDATSHTSDVELEQSLRRVLDLTDEPRVLVERRPYATASSHPVEEIRIRYAGGERWLVFKDLSRGAMLPGARKVRPAFLREPMREIEIYRSVLGSAQLGTARCYGTDVDGNRERYWLFLERVAAEQLCLEGDFGVWRHVARWLAQFHGTFMQSPGRPDSNLLEHAIHYDEAYYRRWMRRAVRFQHRRQEESRSKRHQLSWLAQRYDRVVERLTALPRTLIHGEFYPANILVEPLAAESRICPIDWEMTGYGPGLLDLAALSAGKWDAAAKESLTQAYIQGWPGEGNTAGNAANPAELDCCRLHMAVQWLGWAQEWRPPASHAHDWLAEAMALAEKLAL